MGQTEKELEEPTTTPLDEMVQIPRWQMVDTWQKDIADYRNPTIGANVDSFDELLGKLFVNFELLGLPERQAKALTGSVRRMGWEWFDRHLPNPSGLASPSLQARRERGIDKSEVNN
jgi:hypothetical protein